MLLSVLELIFFLELFFFFPLLDWKIFLVFKLSYSFLISERTLSYMSGIPFVSQNSLALSSGVTFYFIQIIIYKNVKLFFKGYTIAKIVY
ncbi:hypothetical protein BDA99DRAFT_506028 [Phascolomyces articulosus]|uniref:Uncharacterized protein n=1 Tax=Phascolomyces articulosus TaxID=60185 RepID=A0AAD5PF71_9FUNG|nr:hypothetical protein BDA99DRAFT_506028 [Phascolomyces articulosus]